MALVMITLTIESDDPTPVPLDATRYTIQDVTQTTTIHEGITDASGQDTFSLAESTNYKLLLSKTFTTFTTPEDLVVAAGPDPQEHTFSGTYNYPTPPAPDLCTLYGVVLDLSGTPLEDAAVIVENLFNVTDVGGNAIFGPKLDVVTDENGAFTIDLVRGTTVRLIVQNTDIAARVLVPDQGSINITKLLASAEAEIAPPVQG